MGDSISRGYEMEQERRHEEMREMKLVGEIAVCQSGIPGLITHIGDRAFHGISLYTGGAWQSIRPEKISIRKLVFLRGERDKARRIFQL